MQSQLETIEPGSFPGFLRYLHEGERHYRLGIQHLVDRDFRTAADFFTLSNLSLLFQVKPLVNHYRNMSAYFTDPRLKAAFTFQDVYMGLSPFEAPATFSMMPYTELAHGVWYPRGGMYRLVEALMQLARQAGVEFVFDAAVERIELRRRAARGVVAGGWSAACLRMLCSPTPICPMSTSNCSPGRSRWKSGPQALLLLGHQLLLGSRSALSRPRPHTLFLADDYRQNFTSIIRDLDLPANPSLYVHAPPAWTLPWPRPGKTH